MKSEIKKSVVVIATVVMIFSMYSCKSDSDSNKSLSTSESITTTVESTASKQSTVSTTSENIKKADVSDTQPSDTIAANTDSATDSVDMDCLKYDFKGLKTEKYINILKSGRYKMVLQINEEGIDTSEERYVDVSQNRLLSILGSSDVNFKMLSKDNKTYYILDNTYCKTEDEDAYSDVDMIFNNLGYVESGEKEIDGKTCFYDEYYEPSSNCTIKICVDDQNKIYCIEEPENTTIINELSDEFDDSVFNALDGCTEISEDEFMKYFSDPSEDSLPAE